MKSVDLKTLEEARQALSAAILAEGGRVLSDGSVEGSLSCGPVGVLKTSAGLEHLCAGSHGERLKDALITAGILGHHLTMDCYGRPEKLVWSVTAGDGEQLADEIGRFLDGDGRKP